MGAPTQRKTATRCARACTDGIDALARNAQLGAHEWRRALASPKAPLCFPRSVAAVASFRERVTTRRMHVHVSCVGPSRWLIERCLGATARDRREFAHVVACV